MFVDGQKELISKRRLNVCSKTLRDWLPLIPSTPEAISINKPGFNVSVFVEQEISFEEKYIKK